jgi:pimeloyl-ACP methyl ester carboxylesterase
MKAETIGILGHDIFIRFRINGSGRIPVLFLHGIGESGRCFIDAFGLPKAFDVIVPDLLGFGKSGWAENNRDYSIESQIGILREVISHFDLRNIVLVGHSYGGMLGTLLSAENTGGRVGKFLNVEGGIAHDTAIQSIHALSVLGEYGGDMERFGYWLREGDFKKTVLEDMESPSTIKYFDSVVECDPAAFAMTAREVCAALESRENDGMNEISRAYKNLKIPGIYCVGTRPVMDSAKRFLDENGLEYRVFNVASHWLMLDAREEFYAFLEGYIES